MASCNMDGCGDLILGYWADICAADVPPQAQQSQPEKTLLLQEVQNWARSRFLSIGARGLRAGTGSGAVKERVTMLWDTLYSG